MRKWACLLGAALMLVGCGSLEVTSMTTEILEPQMEEAKNKGQIYSRDEEEITKLKAFSDKLADAYPYYHGKDESGHYLHLQEEVVRQMGVPLSESVYGQELEAIYPGILEFIKGVENETTDKRPKSTVIDNHYIRMIPRHLYDMENIYGMTSYLLIENNNVRLEDAYMKQLANAVSEGHFMAYEPYITGPQKLLRFATPNFGRYSYVGEYIDETYTKGITYYEEGAVAYQLYIAEDQLQKVRLVVEKLEGESLEQLYFEPLLTWCQDEFGMNTDQLAKVQGVIDLASSGSTKKEKGSLDGYLYTYQAFKSSDNWGFDVGEKRYRETIEIVIEMK